MSATMSGSARYSANAVSVIWVSAPSASANSSPHDGGVYIQEVTRQGAAEQGADLVGDSVVGMQDRPDVELNWFVSAPVD